MTDSVPPSPIRFFGLDRQFARYRDEFMAIAERVLSTGSVLQGEPVAAFEAALRQLTGRGHAVAVGSCTDALAFALIAAGIKPGDEVLVTAFSFFASVSPILRVGATPRFIDIDPDTFQTAPDLLEQAVGPRTRAILAVHMFGQTLPMDRIEAIARRHSLVLIEDAAQALGATDCGRVAGSMGLASCLSFDPTKVIGSFGSAGALVTDDPALARTARMLRYHGRDPESRRYAMLGYNSQLSSEMAAMLVFKLSKSAEWEERRARIAAIYQRRLAGVGDLILPAPRPGSTHNWHKYVLKTKARDALAASLRAAGIETMIHYPHPLSDEPAVAALGLPPQATEVPNTRAVCPGVLSLPIHAELEPDEADYVAERVCAHFDG